jgi:amphi-Trp domain-containing protein
LGRLLTDATLWIILGIACYSRRIGKETRMADKEAKRLAKQEKRAQKAERRQHRRKAQAVLSREQIAEQLRALASQFETGQFVLGDKALDLPPTAEFEIAYKLRRRGGHQVEVEIEWGGPAEAPLLPTG